MRNRIDILHMFTSINVWVIIDQVNIISNTYTCMHCRPYPLDYSPYWAYSSLSSPLILGKSIICSVLVDHTSFKTQWQTCCKYELAFKFVKKSSSCNFETNMQFVLNRPLGYDYNQHSSLSDWLQYSYSSGDSSSLDKYSFVFEYCQALFRLSRMLSS